MLNVEEAIREVQTKSDKDIETETAYKWASRAIACYLLYKKTGDMQFFLRGEEYRHEAIEHGALAGDDVLRVIRLEVTRGRSKAILGTV